MRPLLEEMSQGAAKVFLACLELCKQQNGGFSTGPIAVSRDTLVRATNLNYYKVTDLLHELGALGLLSQESPGKYRVTASNRPWLRVQEGATTRVNGHRPTRVTRVTSPNKVHDNTVQSNTESLNTETSIDRNTARANSRITSVSPDVISLVQKSCRIMGINPPVGSAYVKGARRTAAERLREGHTVEELLKVVKWAMARWIQGERFAALKTFNFLWGQQLPALIATAKGGVVGGGGWGQPERVFKNVIKGETPDGERPGADRFLPPENKQPY